MERLCQTGTELNTKAIAAIVHCQNESVKSSKAFVHKHFCEETNTHDAVTFLLRMSSASTLTRYLSRMVFLTYLLKGYTYDRTRDEASLTWTDQRVDGEEPDEVQ